MFPKIGIFTFVLAAGRPNSNFRFLRSCLRLPPVARLLWKLSRLIPACQEKERERKGQLAMHTHFRYTGQIVIFCETKCIRVRNVAHTLRVRSNRKFTSHIFMCPKHLLSSLTSYNTLRSYMQYMRVGVYRDFR